MNKCPGASEKPQVMKQGIKSLAKVSDCLHWIKDSTELPARADSRLRGEAKRLRDDVQEASHSWDLGGAVQLAGI